jgi:dihydroorotate dehydrogenase electron transfer subunit
LSLTRTKINRKTMQKILATIIRHVEECPRHFRMTLHAPDIAVNARAGHFVHVLARDSNSFDPLLRRAFSILAIRGDEIEILYRVEGRGTANLSRLQKDDIVDLLGPLGVPFRPPLGKALLVGGGVGVPPMAMLASQEAKRMDGEGNGGLVALLGARSETEVLCLEDFARYGVPVEIATDDGSTGHHGMVTVLLERHLQAEAGDGEGGKAEQGEMSIRTVYACGPLPMLRAVAAMCEKYGAPCQVSLEENMPCGVGICNGCVVPALGEGDDFTRFRRICVEGPVMDSREIDWVGF